MKLLFRYLSLLLVCLFSFVLFSTQVLASDTSFSLPPSIYYRFDLLDKDKTVLTTNSPDAVRLINSGTTTKWSIPGTPIIHTFPQYLAIEYGTSPDGIDVITNNVFFKKGDGFSLNVGGLFDCLVYFDTEGNDIKIRERTVFKSSITVELYSNSGEKQIVTPVVNSKSISDGRISFSIDVDEVPFDVYYLKVYLYDTTSPFGGSAPSSYYGWNRRFICDNKTYHSFNVIPEEKGLLKTIIETITFGFGDLADKIANLPDLIINGIKNVLVSVFVPSDEFLDYFWTNFNDICGLKFGILWDMPSFILSNAQDTVDVLLADDVQSSIEIPLIEIPLPEGVILRFGGWEVDLYYWQFSPVYDAIWLISGGLGTFLFIKGVRKRYEDVFGG